MHTWVPQDELKVLVLARSLHTHGTNMSGRGIDIDNLLDCGVAAEAASAPCNLVFDTDISEY